MIDRICMIESLATASVCSPVMLADVDRTCLPIIILLTREAAFFLCGFFFLAFFLRMFYSPDCP